jgi:hypothetical protein
MEKLASVLPAPSSGSRFSASPALIAAFTMRAERSWHPAGRIPIVSISTSSGAVLCQRARSSASAGCTASRNCRWRRSSAAASTERRPTVTRDSKAIELPEVPPSTRSTLKVVFGSLGT